MKEIISYYADDGKSFNNKADCLAYEAECEKVNKIFRDDIIAFDEYGILLTEKEHKIGDATFIKVKSADAFQLFNKISYYEEGYCALLEGIPREGIFYYNNEQWKDLDEEIKELQRIREMFDN